MRNRFLTGCLLLISILPQSVKADEGMWIPLLIEKYNIKLMREKGFKLRAEDIYSVNKACMKDAVVKFGGGCTGELISSEGLVITNHHCGYGQIQRHSTLEHDYLTTGFWAMSRQEELVNPGLTVTFLKRMEDVTSKVLEGVRDDMNDEERDKVIGGNIDKIVKEAVAGTDYSAFVTPFYMGNQYFLFVNETYRDIRLVGAPPSAIGKFGGETDNWIWPRHTGDFSLFRIYAGKDNKPADYSKDNVPYKPAYFFPVSLNGVKEGDFTMVFGYPGSTAEYVPSYHIEMIRNYMNPKLIEIRTKKIDIMEEAMNTDPLIRIQYSAKKSGIANSWKRWIGEDQGLDKMGTIEKKKAYEKRISEWIEADASRKAKYGNVLPRYRELYSDLEEYNIVNSYTNEVFNYYGAEAVSFARNMKALAKLVEEKAGADKIETMKINLIQAGKGFFKNYNYNTDKKLFTAVLTMYGITLDEKWQAPEYRRLKKECRGDFASLANKLYPVSVFTDQDRFDNYVKNFRYSELSKLNKDPFYLLITSVSDFLSDNIRPELGRVSESIQTLNRIYMTAQMEFEKDRVFYPDANSTLRVAYGNVKGYYSRDAVFFTNHTGLTGIMEKDNPAIYDYKVPEKLKELYRVKDFGPYAQDGDVPVCFIANNHTTGGNSGSPVINAEGQLIGINFDRAWEGVASDLAYNPDQSRNISLDIRYALFLIDKFAGAGYLLNEMKIVGRELVEP
ncbi:MAG TPA: S46 family peptidase [Bacteroidales bacterium]|nr:S46 family peptidase [Bacteroidales bacterium]